MIHIKDHKQGELFDPWSFLSPKRRRLLDRSWAGVIDIADDKMLAALTLYPSLSGTPTLGLNDILALCKEREINCGIDESIIQETIGEVVGETS